MHNNITKEDIINDQKLIKELKDISDHCAKQKYWENNNTEKKEEKLPFTIMIDRII